MQPISPSPFHPEVGTTDSFYCVTESQALRAAGTHSLGVSGNQRHSFQTDEYQASKSPLGGRTDSRDKCFLRQRDTGESRYNPTFV